MTSLLLTLLFAAGALWLWASPPAELVRVAAEYGAYTRRVTVNLEVNVPDAVWCAVRLRELESSHVCYVAHRLRKLVAGKP